MSGSHAASSQRKRQDRDKLPALGGREGGDRKKLPVNLVVRSQRARPQIYTPCQRKIENRHARHTYVLLPPQLSVEGAGSFNTGSSVQELSVGRSVKHSKGTSTYSVQVKERLVSWVSERCRRYRMTRGLHTLFGQRTVQSMLMFFRCNEVFLLTPRFAERL